MKISGFILLLWSSQVLADYCQCEVFAVAPLSVSKKVGSYSVGEFKTSYFGKYDAEAQKSCRSECQKESMREYDANFLREKLTPWMTQLIAGGAAGYNCTGLTDYKIPVRVSAKIGDYSLGLVHQSMVFLHYNRSCF
jgi:hypothetical protein